jgi:amino acid transporter
MRQRQREDAMSAPQHGNVPAAPDARDLPSAPPPEPDAPAAASPDRASDESSQSELVTGREHLGSRYYRVRFMRPRRVTIDAGEPRSEIAEPPQAGIFTRLKHVLIGTPIPSEKAIHERIGIVKALALLSSDALSSVAYGTEASLAILLTAGIALSSINLAIGAIIIVLLAIVAFSYRQTIMHYPTGGGSYIVASHHLGEIPGLIAAAALLLDYILTVSVSVSAGVDAVTSALPALFALRVWIGVVFIATIVIINLRGVRESGAIFAVPTYLFVGSYLVVILTGFLHAIGTGGMLAAVAPHAHPPQLDGTYQPIPITDHLSVFLILTAFASGCAAMTGTEAIADGVPVFRGETPRNQSVNAAKTLIIMASLLAIMYGGTTFLTWRFGLLAYQNSNPTVLSQIADLLFGHSWFYYVFQLATTLILTLAANTSFSDFPRLSSILARDNYMPHAFQLRGGRLAFNTGILVLGVLSSALLIIFHGSTDALINLYALGVFTAFTLSQSGMVARWLREKEPGWHYGVVISTIGAVATGIVTIIIVVSKAPRGAWVILLLVPLLLLMFKGIKLHYQRVAEAVAEMPILKPSEQRHVMIVPVASLNKLAIRGLAYARSLTPYVMAVNVSLDKEASEEVRREWNEVRDKYLRGGPVPDEVDLSAAYDDTKKGAYMTPGPELVIIESPYRLLAGPIIRYIDKFHKAHPKDVITVVLPEYVPQHFWDNILHNQTALWLKLALLSRPYVVTTNVPYRQDAQ